jgi:hypothetical protein
MLGSPAHLLAKYTVEARAGMLTGANEGAVFLTNLTC